MATAVTQEPRGPPGQRGPVPKGEAGAGRSAGPAPEGGAGPRRKYGPRRQPRCPQGLPAPASQRGPSSARSRAAPRPRPPPSEAYGALQCLRERGGRGPATRGTAAWGGRGGMDGENAGRLWGRRATAPALRRGQRLPASDLFGPATTRPQSEGRHGRGSEDGTRGSRGGARPQDRRRRGVRRCSQSHRLSHYCLSHTRRQHRNFREHILPGGRRRGGARGRTVPPPPGEGSDWRNRRGNAHSLQNVPAARCGPHPPTVGEGRRWHDGGLSRLLTELMLCWASPLSLGDWEISVFLFLSSCICSSVVPAGRENDSCIAQCIGFYLNRPSACWCCPCVFQQYVTIKYKFSQS